MPNPTLTMSMFANRDDYNAALAEYEIDEPAALATPPAAAPDEAMVLRGARALCQINAESCNVDVDDKWMMYSEEYKQEARTILTAALTGEKA